MPFEGEQFDELLSGHLDNQLSNAELAELKAALDHDEKLRGKLDDLKQIRSQVKRLGELSSTHSFPSNFAASVVAEARRRAIEAGLPESHHVLAVDEVIRSVGQTWRVSLRVIGTVAALAAMILLSVYLPIWFGGSGNDSDGLIAVVPEPLPAEELPLEELPTESVPAAVKYVGDSDFQIMYTLVIDMELSKAAFDNEYISGVFGNAGIELKDPIVASNEIKAVLADARMMVQPEDEEAGEAFIYFVHAKTDAVGRVLEALYDDLQNVPVLRMDVAFETPANKLMKRMAEGSGQRFAVNDSVAAPLAANPRARISPFAGIGAQGQLVSVGNRRMPEGSGPNMGLLGDGTSAFLLLVRLPK